MSSKKTKAIKLAIAALEYLRRQRYAAGNAAFNMGHDLDFAIKDHAKYQEYTEAIDDLKSMMNEPAQIAFNLEPLGGSDA